MTQIYKRIFIIQVYKINISKSLHELYNRITFDSTQTENDMKTVANRLKNAIEEKLAKRSTDQLKNDAVTAMKSNDYGANIIFVTAMTMLEERLGKEEYSKFEESL